MAELFGAACRDLGHAWDQESDWWLVWRTGRDRHRRLVAERRCECLRDCGAVAIDRAYPSTLKPLGRRRISYSKPEYLGQQLDGIRVTRYSARIWRAHRTELHRDDQP